MGGQARTVSSQGTTGQSAVQPRRVPTGWGPWDSLSPFRMPAPGCLQTLLRLEPGLEGGAGRHLGRRCTSAGVGVGTTDRPHDFSPGSAHLHTGAWPFSLVSAGSSLGWLRLLLQLPKPSWDIPAIHIGTDRAQMD